MASPETTSHSPATQQSGSYTVVARRYRPKSFTELVGQEHIGQALSKAIATGRVGHAYLFTGARGVGKTSSARIFAKALNAPSGPTAEALPSSDIADAIDAGEDVDVIEIDGASNRGIDEIRQLRANVSVRPSRSRYKIYIIDEVHMLTSQAFNALLKTLEEPPEHVKFIFCTTDPEKIPITVLSRCQRFDFAPVQTDAIQGRLAEICAAEGFEADTEALTMIARRAAGSMRDSQSLLEQVRSFSNGRISLDQVHALLGTADEGRLRELTETLAARDAAGALTLVANAISAGTDSGQLAEQLLSYFRDLMAVAVGGGPELLKLANPTGYTALKELADSWGLQTILAALQLLDESLVRMRHSVQSQALFEVALIQIAQLQDLATVARLIEALSKGGPLPATAPARPALPEKKNTEPAVATSTAKPNPPATTALAPSTSATSRPTQPNAQVSSAVQNVASSAGSTPTAASSSTSLNSPATGISSGQSSNSTGQATEQLSSQSPAAGPAPHTAIANPNGLASPALTMSEQNASAATAQSGQQLAAPHSQSSSTLEGMDAGLALWKRAMSTVDGMLADFALMAVAVEQNDECEWTIVFPPGLFKAPEYCEVPQRKQVMQEALEIACGRTIQLGFRVLPGQLVRSKVDAGPSATALRTQLMRQMSEHPYVTKVCELLQGEIVKVDPAQSES